MYKVTRRDFLKTAVAGAAAWSFPSREAAAEPAGKKPNIVLIMADDLGYECLGCNGSLSYQTPILDGLAAGGIRFEHCYSQPLCTPSRVQMMTGRYNHRNYTGFGTLDPKEITFGNVLKKAGYATCIAGKWQLGGGAGAPHSFGFDEYLLWHIENKMERYWNPGYWQNGKRRTDIADKYGPDVLCDFILDFIQKKKNGPFFAYYPMCLTHDPFCRTPDSMEGKKGRKGGKEAYFADMVAYMDKIVGRIDTRLAELKLREHTLLIFTGDNGTSASIKTKTKQGTFVGGKSNMTDAGTHVPLVASWPGIAPKGAVLDDLVDFSDFMATFAEAAGTPLPMDRVMDGRSFLPRLRGEKGAPREWIFCHYQPKGEGEGKDAGEFVRNRRWKLYNDGRMYDVPADLQEKSPLAPGNMSNEARTAKTQFEEVLKSLHKT